MKIIPLLIPVLVALVLSFRLLFFSEKKEKAFRILGAYLLLLTLVLSATLLQYQKNFFPQINSLIPIYTVLFYGALLSLAPTVYFYIASLTDKINRYSRIEKIIPHYTIPILLFIINLLAYLPESIEANPTEGTSSLVKNITHYSNFIGLLYLFPGLSFYYVFKSVLVYINHKNKIKEVFSYEEGVNLKWMLIFLFGFVFYVICFIALEPDASPYFVYVPMFMYFLFIGFMGKKQKKVSIHEAIIESGYSSAEKDLEVSVIDDEKRHQLKEKIINYCKEKEPYLDSQLTVYQLAKMIGTNSTYLSSILNTDFQMNFTSFINSHRIEKAKVLLNEPSTNAYTIEAIGQMAGFKSKSAFNRWFKDFTGETPSAYKKNNT